MGRSVDRVSRRLPGSIAFGRKFKCDSARRDCARTPSRSSSADQCHFGQSRCGNRTRVRRAEGGLWAGSGCRADCMVRRPCGPGPTLLTDPLCRRRNHHKSASRHISSRDRHHRYARGGNDQCTRSGPPGRSARTDCRKVRVSRRLRSPPDRPLGRGARPRLGSSAAEVR